MPTSPLTDKELDDLTYLDPDPSIATTAYSLKKVEKGLIRSFIYFVHYQKEINNPIGDDWTNVTVDEFEQFIRANLDYTRRFETLSNLPSISPVSSNQQHQHLDLHHHLHHLPQHYLQ
jgi:hypothetical protein